MNICITHVYMKKWQKEQEEWILREQEKRREKIQDSTLQIGSKRYSFPIDLKKASDWPFLYFNENKEASKRNEKSKTDESRAHHRRKRDNEHSKCDKERGKGHNRHDQGRCTGLGRYRRSCRGTRTALHDRQDIVQITSRRWRGMG